MSLPVSETPTPASSGGKAPGAKMTRYQQIANTLLEEIESGSYPVGTLLPTEHELCDRFDVSRYTVREALRRLFEAGLVARRRGAGTTVIATKQPPLYDLSVSSVIDLFRYSRNTHYEIRDIRPAPLSPTLREELGNIQGNHWSEILGLRFSDVDPRPVGLSRIYANTSFESVASRLEQPYHSVRDAIDVAFDVPIPRMNQMIRATAISDADAALLKIDAGSAGLRVIRSYLSKDGQPVQISDNVHPADRFSMSMSFDRNPDDPDDGAVL